MHADDVKSPLADRLAPVEGNGSTLPAGPALFTNAGGATLHWDRADGAALELRVVSARYHASDFPDLESHFEGNERLSFVADSRLEQLAALEDQQEQIKERYGNVFEDAKTASTEEQQQLIAQKDALIAQYKALDTQTADLKAAVGSPAVVYGGRDDLVLRLTGTGPISFSEMRKVAQGLRVMVRVPVGPGAFGAGSQPPVEVAPGPVAPADVAPDPTAESLTGTSVPSLSGVTPG